MNIKTLLWNGLVKTSIHFGIKEAAEMDNEKFEKLVELICFSHGQECSKCIFKNLTYCFDNVEETSKTLTTAALQNGLPALIDNINILCSKED